MNLTVEQWRAKLQAEAKRIGKSVDPKALERAADDLAHPERFQHKF